MGCDFETASAGSGVQPMKTSRAGLRRLGREAICLATLAAPLIAGNLAWTAMATIDLFLLGRLATDAVAAAGLALALYTLLLVAGTGLVTAIAPLIGAAL